MGYAAPSILRWVWWATPRFEPTLHVLLIKNFPHPGPLPEGEGKASFVGYAAPPHPTLGFVGYAAPTHPTLGLVGYAAL